ncbi:hypothetical protein JTE90_001486 [Oedothorax gibbosus]|uniref:Uncharacterized protein n=1 Tax=Oedothorax gibbosus TaxID=931172 RepID=A0AAV6TQJ3_9ARAC|nr:hypothetical protein JTE90_001486 [Oedothorax gibbosus]
MVAVDVEDLSEEVEKCVFRRHKSWGFSRMVAVDVEDLSEEVEVLGIETSFSSNAPVLSSRLSMISDISR